jgi:hypothetical protein
LERDPGNGKVQKGNELNLQKEGLKGAMNVTLGKGRFKRAMKLICKKKD